MKLPLNKTAEVVAAEHRLMLTRFDQMKAALQAIVTDLAQDKLEDPIGFAERERSGFYRLGKGAVNKVNDLLRKIS